MTSEKQSALKTLFWDPIPWNAPNGFPTFGGLQFWADVYLFQDWRIQFHVQRGTYRLLDGFNWQHAAGTYEECSSALDRIRRERHLEGWTTPSVILLHGLIRTRHCMDVLADHLKHRGFAVYNVEYPSTLLSVEEHARHVGRVIDGLVDTDTIHLVGFSMGGVVGRTYLERGPDERVQRMVTIGTPHQGSDKASFFSKLGFLGFLGPGACQLVCGEDGVSHQVGCDPNRYVNVEIGVIAGGGPGGWGYSMILPRDNDGVVTVASTMLAGARDFLLVRGHHSFLPSNLRVREATTNFLKHGYFVSESKRRPIDWVRWSGSGSRRAVVAGPLFAE